MSGPDGYVFPWPWVDLREASQTDARRARVEEVLLELGTEHDLLRDGFEVLADFVRQDEVLIQAASGFAMLHLTWSRRRDDTTVRCFQDWDEVLAEIDDMVENW